MPAPDAPTRRAAVRVLSVVLVMAVLGGVLASVAGAATVIYSRPPVVGWQTDGTVYVVRIVGDTVYVGGQFSEIRAQRRAEVATRRNLAAFDLRTGAPLPGFRADANGPVRSIRPNGATLIVSGRFTQIGRQVRSRVAEIDAGTGVPTAWTPPVIDGPVYAARPVGNRIVVGGTFKSVGGAARRSLAALDRSTGAFVPSWSGNVDGTVRSIEASPDGSRLYLSGRFRSVAGKDRRHLAAVGAATGRPLPVFFTRPAEWLWDLTLSSDGSMLYGACRCNRAFGWRTSDGRLVVRSPLVGGDVQAVSYRAGTLYFGFHDSAFGDDTLRLLAADATTGAVDDGFRPAIDTFFGVWALDASAAGLVAGGTFKNVDGAQTQGFAIFPSTVSADVEAPAAPGALTLGSGPTLQWSPSADNVAVEGYVIRRNGVRVGFTNATSWVDPTALPNRRVAYTVTAVDPAGNRSAASSAPLLVPSAAVARGARWRYQALGTDLGTAWRQLDYNARSWPMAPGLFGYGNAAVRTVVPPAPGGLRPVTTYFRKTFTVSDPSAVEALTLELVRDDGAIAYLNGTEVMRSNLPAGAVSALTPARRAVRSARAAVSPVTVAIPPSALRTGANVLTVEVHQAKASGGDLTFDAALRVHTAG